MNYKKRIKRKTSKKMISMNIFINCNFFNCTNNLIGARQQPRHFFTIIYPPNMMTGENKCKIIKKIRKISKKKKEKKQDQE